MRNTCSSCRILFPLTSWNRSEFTFTDKVFMISFLCDRNPFKIYILLCVHNMKSAILDFTSALISPFVIQQRNNCGAVRMVSFPFHFNWTVLQQPWFVQFLYPRWERRVCTTLFHNKNRQLIKAKCSIFQWWHFNEMLLFARLRTMDKQKSICFKAVIRYQNAIMYICIQPSRTKVISNKQK